MKKKNPTEKEIDDYITHLMQQGCTKEQARGAASYKFHGPDSILLNQPFPEPIIKPKD